MAIPVFPAGANVGLSPNTAGSYSPDPTIYSQGLRAGLAEGTPLSQAVDGYNRGIEIDQNQRSNEANIVAQEERNQILARANTPEAIARAERAAAFEEFKQKQILETQTLQAKTAADKQALDIKKFALDAQKDELAIKKDTIAIGLEEKQQAQKSTILDSFNALGQDNIDSIAQGLAGLEANKNVLAANSITQKGKDVSVDPVYTANMQNIVERAKSTGNPVLVQRADKLQKEYFQQISNAQNIAAGKPISLGADAPAVATENGTPEYNLGNGQTIREKAQPGLSSEADKLYTASQDIDSKSSIGNTPQQRDRELQLNRQKLKEQGLSEEEISKQLGTSTTENAQVDEATYKSKRLAYFTKQRLDQIAASGGDPGDKTNQANAQAYAKEMYAGNQFTDKQLTELGTKTSSISKARADLDKTRTAFERLQQLMVETGVDPRLGKTQSLGQLKDALTAKVANDPDKTKLIDDVYRSLDASAITGMLATLNEANMGSRLADSNKESERLLATQVGLDKSLAANLGVLQAAMGTAYNREQQLDIMRFAASSNKPYSTAIGLIDKYNDISPAVVDGTIDGQKFPVSNTGALRGRDFISKYYFDEAKAAPSITNIPTPSNPDVPTTPDGRVAEAPGVTKADVPRVATEVADIVGLGREAFKATVPPGEAIPDKHPDFTPSPALITRQMNVESGGNPWAKNKDTTAKGLFQFIDDTGKPLWKELGFEGPYNPYDAEKSTAMYQLHMSKLLKQFGGDTRAAVASHLLGPGTVHRYRDKLDGDTQATWDQVLLRMPDEVPIMGNGDKVIAKVPKKDIIQYVDKVMGDGGKAAGKSLAKQAFGLYKEQVLDRVFNEQTRSQATSFLMGAADGATFGATGELLELASPGLGKRYDQSKAAEISGMEDIASYTVGAVGGAYVSPVMKILGAGARGLGILGTAKAAPIVSEVVGNTSALDAGIAGMKGAAIGGGITGFMEGDEAGGDYNLGKRAISGLTTGGVSAVLGGALGATGQAIYNKLYPSEVTDDIAKAIVGTSTEDQVLAKNASIDTPNKTILNTATSSETEAAAKNTIGSTKGAGEMLGTKADEIESSAANKVSKTIGNDGSTRTDTGAKAAEGVKKSQDAIVAERRARAKASYGSAEESLTSVPLQTPIKKASGEVITEHKAFTSPRVKELMENSIVQDEIAAVQATKDFGEGKLPGNDFKVLDKVRRNIAESSPNADSDKAQLAEALKVAMTEEAPLYKEAIRDYKKFSSLTDTATKGKAMKGLANMADEQKTRNVADFGKALFANDANAINKMTKLLDPQALEYTQNAAAAYVDDIFNTTGDIPRDILPKLDVLFGKGTGAKLEQELIANQAAKETAAGLRRIGNIDPTTKELYSTMQKGAQGAPIVTRLGSVTRSAFKTIADLVGNDKSITPKQVEEVVSVLSDNQAGKEFLNTIVKKFGEKNAASLQGVFSDPTLNPQQKAQILGQLFGETELTSAE